MSRSMPLLVSIAAFLSLTSGCAVLHSTQIGEIDSQTVLEGRRFDILLEPEKRPRQGVYTFYGTSPRSEMCVVGFEPNPVHAPKLALQMRKTWAPKARLFHIFGAAITSSNAAARGRTSKSTSVPACTCRMGLGAAS